jgi:ABC-type glycerol-3-phosphate transport system permease component
MDASGSGAIVRRLAATATYVTATVAVIVMLFPLFWMMSLSFRADTEQFVIPPTLLPAEPVVGNYTRLLQETNFGWYVWNSLVIATATVVFTLTIACPGAYALTRFSFLARPVFATGILFIYMFPPMFLGIPLFVIFSSLKLTNSFVGLVLAHTTFALPFLLWMLRDFFLAIPRELEEAALVDGCSRPGALWRVVLPLARPGLIAAGIFAFILSWNDYVYALILMTSESRKTITVGLSLFVESTTIEPGLMTAGGVLVTVPVLVLFMFVQRYLVQGLAAGAIR